MAELSENIVLLRHQSKMSQSDLAGKLFVTPQAVSRWERGETEPDVETIKKLAEVFEVSVEDIINGPGSAFTKQLEKKIYKGYLIGSISMSFAAIIFAVLTLVGVNAVPIFIVLVTLSFVYLGVIFYFELYKLRLKRTPRKKDEENGTK